MYTLPDGYSIHRERLQLGAFRILLCSHILIRKIEEDKGKHEKQLVYLSSRVYVSTLQAIGQASTGHNNPNVLIPPLVNKVPFFMSLYSPMHSLI